MVRKHSGPAEESQLYLSLLVSHMWRCDIRYESLPSCASAKGSCQCEGVAAHAACFARSCALCRRRQGEAEGSRRAAWWPWARATRHGGCGTMVSLRWHEAHHSSYRHGVHYEECVRAYHVSFTWL